MFVKLTQKQVEDKIRFIHNYVAAENAASGSLVDPNANITTKNICTLAGELHKDFNIQIKRGIVTSKLTQLYGQELADEYIRQLENHEIYSHDESNCTSVYCASISMYPFLLSGMESLGGEAKCPKHLSSFSGNFVNLCFAVSSQLCGAVGTVEVLSYFDYFARKDYGEDYTDWLSNPVTPEQEKKAKEIENHIQSIVYAINQPAAARGFQSIFANWAIFDKHYFEAIFRDFVFPDFTVPNWTSVDKLQRFFLKWFNEERTKALLTFPVITASLLTKDGKPRDEETARFLAKELSEGNSFFVFMSEDPYAISSCCRLRSETDNKASFSSSLGAGGIATGSINVITININRLVQDALKDYEETDYEKKLEVIRKAVTLQTRKIHSYQIATKSYFDDLRRDKMIPIYDAGFVQMEKQFLTVGINGLTEGAEFLGLEIGRNDPYEKYIVAIVKTIDDLNRQAKTKDYMFNLEMVPAENLGVKFAKWDKKAGYKVNRNCYNSYLYLSEDACISVVDKMKLYRKELSQYMSGGSALHLALEEYPDAEGYFKLFCLAAKLGVPYWCTNIVITCCEEPGCKYINKHNLNYCSKCGSKNVAHATRIIGYLKRIDSWANARKREAELRRYHKEVVFNQEEGEV